MSQSKTNVLAEAIVAILLGDNTPTGNAVESIQEQVGNRIYRTFNDSVTQFPQINYEVEDGPDDIGLPTGFYFLEVTVRVPFDVSEAQEKRENIATRVLFLLNKKPEALNDAVPGKDLRCRLIIKESATRTEDVLLRLFNKTIRFRIQIDDEILT